MKQIMRSKMVYESPPLTPYQPRDSRRDEAYEVARDELLAAIALAEAEEFFGMRAALVEMLRDLEVTHAA